MAASSYGLPLTLPRERTDPPRLDVPWQIRENPRRIEMWEYCQGVRERWDAWESEMIRLRLIEDTRSRQ